MVPIVKKKQPSYQEARAVVIVPNRRKKKIQYVLESLSEEDIQLLTEDLLKSDSEVSTAAISRVLRHMGMAISDSAVRKYRIEIRDKGT